VVTALSAHPPTTHPNYLSRGKGNRWIGGRESTNSGDQPDFLLASGAVRAVEVASMGMRRFLIYVLVGAVTFAFIAGGLASPPWTPGHRPRLLWAKVVRLLGL
jgi:hypothetical protein